MANPFLKSCKSKKSKFHGAGREDIDARNLGGRPFVIEIIKPLKRKIDLKKIYQVLKKNPKVNARKLKFADKDLILKLKTAKIDKTYRAEVTFSKNIDKKLLKNIKKFAKEPILQQTPNRVKHRRADLTRRRLIKSISWKTKNKKQLIFTIRTEGGLYIKELISGDQGRTKPNIAEILNNKVKKIRLDVVKVHSNI